MSLKQYQAFLKAAELHSVSAAAEALGISQSALTQAIAALEKQFGFAVLSRSRSGTQLTQEGRRVYEAVRQVVHAEAALSAAVRDVRETGSGVIRIATFKSVAVSWLPAMMKAFQAEHPEARFRLFDGAYAEVDAYVRSGAVDFGFVSLPDTLDCEHIPVREDRLLAVLPQGHPLAEAERVPVTQFGREPVVSLVDSTNQDALRVWNAAGVTPDVRFKTADDYALISMVESGLGICITHELVLKSDNHNVVVRELDPPAHRTIAIALPGFKSAKPLVQDFIRFVQRWTKAHPEMTETSAPCSKSEQGADVLVLSRYAICSGCTVSSAHASRTFCPPMTQTAACSFAALIASARAASVSGVVARSSALCCWRSSFVTPESVRAAAATPAARTVSTGSRLPTALMIYFSTSAALRLMERSASPQPEKAFRLPATFGSR